MGRGSLTTRPREGAESSLATRTGGKTGDCLATRQGGGDKMVTRAYDKWFWKEIQQEGNFKGAGYTMYFRQIGTRTVGPRGPSVRPEKDDSWAPIYIAPCYEPLYKILLYREIQGHSPMQCGTSLDEFVGLRDSGSSSSFCVSRF